MLLQLLDHALVLLSHNSCNQVAHARIDQLGVLQEREMATSSSSDHLDAVVVDADSFQLAVLVVNGRIFGRSSTAVQQFGCGREQLVRH